MNTREKIIEIISENSGISNASEYLHSNDDLIQFGVNSIAFIKIVVALEREFDFEFEQKDLDYKKFTSLNLLHDYVEERMRETEQTS